jgi:mono/diheme cytochrome c family protein
LLADAVSPTAVPADELSPAEVMKRKLVAAQTILGALALEDFSTVQTNAQRLVRLAVHPNWKAATFQDYRLRLEEFIRLSRELAAAAGRQDVEATTAGYTRLVTSCVDCHRRMRGNSAGAKSESDLGTLIAAVIANQTSKPN